MSAAPSSELLSKLFGAPAAEGCLGDRARLQGMLDFEAALARAEARVGLIPAQAAQSIGRQCRAELFDLAQLADGTEKAGNTAIPLVSALTSLVGADDPGAGRFVHRPLRRPNGFPCIPKAAFCQGLRRSRSSRSSPG